MLFRSSRLADCAAVIQRGLDLQIAAEDWREAVTVGGNLALVWVHLGRFEAATGLPERADDWLSQLGEAEGTMAAHHHLKRGRALLGLGRPGSAIRAFERARDLHAAHKLRDAWRLTCEHALAIAQAAAGHPAAAALCDRADAALRAARGRVPGGPPEPARSRR